jgi:hypothetical protein
MREPELNNEHGTTLLQMQQKLLKRERKLCHCDTKKTQMIQIKED